MNNSKSIILIAVVVIVVGGFLVLRSKDNGVYKVQNNQEQTQTETNVATSSDNTSGIVPTIKLYTLTEVSVHSSQSSCWSAINGGVYDLTAWISKHPGGEKAILSICGKDGSAAFNGQHGGAAQQANILATFKIGNLK